MQGGAESDAQQCRQPGGHSGCRRDPPLVAVLQTHVGNAGLTEVVCMVLNCTPWQAMRTIRWPLRQQGQPAGGSGAAMARGQGGGSAGIVLRPVGPGACNSGTRAAVRTADAMARIH